jgi:PII-like signaling protein
MRVVAESRFPTHPAKRVAMMLNHRDRAGHGSLMIELLQRARHDKLAGATVFQALEGFGASGRVHRTHVVVDDSPVMVVVIDRPDRIDAFLKSVEGLLDNVLVTVDDVDVIEI